MGSFRTFIIRALLILLPALLMAFSLFSFDSLTKLEVILLAFLSLSLLWLFYELLSRPQQQVKIKEESTPLEKILTGIRRLETTKEAPKDMSAELRIMHILMDQIVREKEKAQRYQKESVAIKEENNKSQGEQKEEPPYILKDPGSHVLTRSHLLEILEKALSSDRIEILVQPIVSLPQCKARHFECFSRIREENGTIYTPDHFVYLAEEENLIRLVDNAMLFRCIQLARASVKKIFNFNFFCNISHHTLLDKDFFKSFGDFLSSNDDLAQHIVFEFHEHAIQEYLEDIEPYLVALKSYGCCFSIDQVTTFDLDLKRLHHLNFKYLKFHSSILLDAISIDSGYRQVEDFKKACDLYEIDVIISHIENEKVVLELSDFQFDYGQGFLFGGPVLSKY